MVGSKPKNAFIAGSMVVALWAQHADFGQVFYAYLLDACPYLIPKYHQRPSNATGLFDFTGKNSPKSILIFDSCVLQNFL